MTPRPKNPILHALQSLAEGGSLDALLALREHELPTPQAWLDTGWEALASLDEHSQEAKLLVEVMKQAWTTVGGTRRAWSCAAPTQGQVLWCRALRAMGAPA